ncbi:MAG: NAD-dependent deacylase [Dehalococcoidia bacterium]|nr:NAD-dependent deacylase [Dehalococcoidia bacterium]MDZ4246519.1 NAD-dependent deacylase [Dehalococcoidia bacterium]
MDLETGIERAAGLIKRSHRVVVFTGAGISTESGIPDFRGPGGIWSRYDPEDFTYQRFISSDSARIKHWEMIKETFAIEASPNPAHIAIAELDRLGKLDCIVTQNVDNLHQKAGVSGKKVFELHGNTRWIKCLGCGQRYPMSEISQRLKMGEAVPDCVKCHGILKPDAVFFGETLPQDVLNDAIAHSQSCDLCIVVGSTLLVYPAAYLPYYAVQAGAKLIIINLGETPMDAEASVLIAGKAGEVLSRIIEKVKGSSNDGGALGAE